MSARIRTIKPSFRESQTLGRVCRDARLLLVLLITFADDEGRMPGHPKLLARTLFPFDDDAPDRIDGWLSELEREECITRYSVNGTNYVALSNWHKHQRVDKKQESKIPAPPGREQSHDASRATVIPVASHRDMGRDSSGKTDEQLATHEQEPDDGSRAIESHRDVEREPCHESESLLATDGIGRDKERKGKRDALPPFSSLPEEEERGLSDEEILEEIGARCDPRTIAFSKGIQFLKANGTSEKQARGLLGKLAKATGDDDGLFASKVEVMLAKRPVDPPAFLAAIIRDLKGSKPVRLDADDRWWQEESAE
jgi:hypothetical protein